MDQIRSIFIGTILFIPSLLSAQTAAGLSPLAELSLIQHKPIEIPFKNDHPLNTEGGHLQGIQQCLHGEKKYFILSGSNSTDSYLAFVDSDDRKVVGIATLFDAPLKHAGGFQAYENYLAVGVEDNEARDQSLVCFYDVSNLPNFSNVPVFVLRRSGTYERSTAGCVGLVRMGVHWLAVVGDWNTRNLDFYMSESDDLSEGLSLKAQVPMSEQSRSEWIDTLWLPYQNINLIYRDSKVYLLGYAGKDGGNIADLFHLDVSDFSNIKVKKLETFALENTGGDFTWGTGVIQENGNIKGVIATPRNIEESSQLYLYPVSEK
ncbi:MAG: hypothetical protein KDC53_13660 [Saprospiraceae bacterium]|nr:hypothetical protein [Saprospiraceae bacterium]